MTLTALAVLGLAVGLDLSIGEPPNALHPVAWFGRVVSVVERKLGGDDEHRKDDRTLRWIGLAIAGCLPLAAAAIVGGLVFVALAVQPVVGAIAASLVLFLTISLRRLLALTRAVVDASGGEDSLETARERVRGLVGRETADLSAADLRSAAVESAGENLADGLVATLVPFAVLAPHSLPLAAAAATWVKAVNTLDSMLGYPSKPIGTASARLDDAVMWLPARVSAVLIALAAADGRALARAAPWAGVPPSPNSGWPMATLACALETRLEKRGAYVLNPDASPPTVEDGARAIRIVGRAGVAAVGLAGLLAVSSSILVAALNPVVVALEVPTSGTLEVTARGVLTAMIGSVLATLTGVSSA